MADSSASAWTGSPLGDDPRRKATVVLLLARELGDPLTAMLAALEVLCVVPNLDGGTRATDVMRRQIREMSRIVETLVDVTRARD